jgi:hypothetical protein
MPRGRVQEQEPQRYATSYHATSQKTQTTDELLTVKHAIKLGVRRCKVVSLDWLDDTLLKNKKLPEKSYLLTTLLKGEREKRIREQKETKGAELADRFVNTSEFKT